MPLHLVGISDRSVWHTVRHARRWDPWDRVSAPAGSPSTSLHDIACGFVSGQLHVCVTTSAGLFHTIRFGPGSWQPWGDARSVFLPALIGSSVAGVGIGDELHVCADGFERSFPLQTLPAVWRAVRTSNPNPALSSWAASAEVTARYRPVQHFACANVAGDQLHIVVRCTDVAGAELLVHNIQFADGSQQSLGDQDMLRLFPNANELRAIRTIAAAGIGKQLHVVGSDGTELFHTIRLNDVAWQDTFGPVRPAVDAGFAGPLSFPACANEGNNLHVCAISGGRIVHTIRLSNPAAWRNPETATSGSFGDVLQAVPTAPGVPAPPPEFSAIACAGE